MPRVAAGPSTTLQVRVLDFQMAALRELAEHRGQPYSLLVRRAIDEFLAREYAAVPR